MSTPIEVCEQRDRKGLYAKARAGVLKEFIGVSDPYEPPETAELAIATETCTLDIVAQHLVETLRDAGYLPETAYR